MFYLIGAILAEGAATYGFYRARRLTRALFRLRTARRAAPGEWPEPVIVGAGIFNLECWAYSVYLIIIELAALPGVFFHGTSYPLRVLEVGGFFLAMSFCLHRAAVGFVAEERERHIAMGLPG